MIAHSPTQSNAPESTNQGRISPIELTDIAHNNDTNARNPTSQGLDVENNPDYIALSSALSLLSSQRSIALDDIIQLQKLKNEALADPKGFYNDLRTNRSIRRMPKMQHVVKAPTIAWKRYGIVNPSLDHRLKRGMVGRTPSFAPVRLFDDDRKSSASSSRR